MPGGGSGHVGTVPGSHLPVAPRASVPFVAWASSRASLPSFVLCVFSRLQLPSIVPCLFCFSFIANLVAVPYVFHLFSIFPVYFVSYS